MHINFFKHLHSLEIRISKLEKELKRQREESEKQLSITRSQIVLAKQGVPIMDYAVMKGYSYTDLSPVNALEIYENPNLIYTVLDVSKEGFVGTRGFDCYLKVPFEKLEEKVEEIKKCKGMVLIISEEGLRSILACEKLTNLGVYNCFNISGGYKYLPVKNKLKESA
jgi:hypothetical protein